MSEEKSVVGYKAFDCDFKCRGFQYEVGKTYEEVSPLQICSSGFHFCKVPISCDNYYEASRIYRNRWAMIKAFGEIQELNDKCACNRIEIVKEMTREEMMEASTGTVSDGYGVKYFIKGVSVRPDQWKSYMVDSKIPQLYSLSESVASFLYVFETRTIQKAAWWNCKITGIDLDGKPFEMNSTSLFRRKNKAKEHTKMLAIKFLKKKAIKTLLNSY
jgi:hypothetical protein